MNLFIKGFIALTAIGALLAFICIATSGTVFPSTYSLAGLVSYSILAFLKPQIAISTFLFLLPVFGNKPGSSQAYNLLMLGLSLQIGCTLSFIKEFIQKFCDKTDENKHAALLPGLWYCIISALSLFPVSASIFWGWFKSSQTNLSELSLLSWNTASALLAREDDAAYPLLSVFWTFLAFSLSYFVYYLCTQNPANRARFCWSLLSGFLLPLLVGLLNYYGQIELTALRGLDPVVNPGGTQYRLQSWFGHSGWFAEYVTMLAPFTMLVLTLSLSFWSRVSILLFLLLVGEIILILTFQRGGWLSYPLSLLAIWASIYVIKRLEQGDLNILGALKASTLKILISLPLTLLISFLIIKSFGSQFGIDQYADRFKDIAKASDRLEFVKAGIALGNLRPIFGLGSESFALQYRREYKQEDGAYFGQIDLPLHGTAHNLYAQTFSGKGALGVLALLLMMFFPIQRACYYVINSNTELIPSDRIIALACACSIIAAFIYGFVQELFYVQSLQYVFFAVIGILASLPIQKCNNLYKYNSKVLLIIAVLFCIHVFYYNNNLRQYPDSFGCYKEEFASDGTSWRWCGLRSSIDLALSSVNEKELTLEIAPNGNNSAQKHQLQIETCKQIVFSKEVLPSERITFKIPSDKINCATIKPGFARLNSGFGSYYIAAKENIKSEDRRILALRWMFN